MKQEHHQAMQTITSVMLVCVALIAVFVMIARRVPEPDSVVTRGGPPIRVADWDATVGAGHRIGPEDASMTIVVFGDYECPVCASFERTVLRPFLHDNSADVAVVVRHWPLSYHRFAYPAARAAECAAAQGHFDDFHNILYDTHDSLGLNTFDELASRVEGINSSEFSACIAKSSSVPSIEADIEHVQAIGGTGTPTVVVNGYRFQVPPTLLVLDSILHSLSNGV